MNIGPKAQDHLQTATDEIFRKRREKFGILADAVIMNGVRENIQTSIDLACDAIENIGARREDVANLFTLAGVSKETALAVVDALRSGE